MADQVQQNANKWTPDQERLIAWLALPKAERKPRTQAALATELCIDEATIWRWKNLPGFREAVSKLAREYVQDDIPEILATIRRKAKGGSIPHIDRALAMAGLEADVEAAGKGNGSIILQQFGSILDKVYGDGDGSSTNE